MADSGSTRSLIDDRNRGILLKKSLELERLLAMLKARRSSGRRGNDGTTAGGQKQLFYSFNLDDHVPSDHLLRGIDQFLDLGELRQHLAPYYSHTGRPSIDPQLMIRMLIVGYCFGIRSERRLCEEVHLNLAYRWFCRLGIGRQVPDHSTFSKNRHGRFRDSDTLRLVFEQVLRRCMTEGLVGGEGFAIDASVVKADANRRAAYPAKRPTGRTGNRSAARCANIWRRWSSPRWRRAHRKQFR